MDKGQRNTEKKREGKKVSGPRKRNARGRTRERRERERERKGRTGEKSETHE